MTPGQGGSGAPALVLCGDWGDGDRCGVAHSERMLLAELPELPPVVDPGDLRATWAALRRARRDGRPVLAVYPTRSTVSRVRPLLGLLVAALLRRGDDLRLHLHEYRIFREVRWALGLVVLVGRPRVVVSSWSEGELLRRSVAGRLGRVRPEVVPPFGPLPPGTTGVDAVDAAGSGVVGVFGSPGPAKDLDLVVEVLRGLPPRFATLELVGRGWDEVAWPADVAERWRIRPLGFVATADLGAVFAGWELAVAPLAGGASDGRSSLRIPLSHGTPTLTELGRPEDLTLRPADLVLVQGSATERAAALHRAAALGADRAARTAGRDEVAAFEADLRARLGSELLGLADDEVTVRG
ncbi:MAG: hypothetical protein ACO1PW_00780 [Actinomycetota bacterium]